MPSMAPTASSIAPNCAPNKPRRFSTSATTTDITAPCLAPESFAFCTKSIATLARISGSLGPGAMQTKRSIPLKRASSPVLNTSTSRPSSLVALSLSGLRDAVRTMQPPLARRALMAASPAFPQFCTTTTGFFSLAALLLLGDIAGMSAISRYCDKVIGLLPVSFWKSPAY